MDTMIAYLVAKKERLNEAEVTGDAVLLKDASTQLSTFLQNQSSYWTAEVRSPSPVCGVDFL
jgi:hypothetical protein